MPNTHDMTQLNANDDWQNLLTAESETHPKRYHIQIQIQIEIEDPETERKRKLVIWQSYQFLLSTGMVINTKAHAVNMAHL